jgi:hypothetical protein
MSTMTISIKVSGFARSILSDERLIIHVAGFYGAFISLCLLLPERITCVIDQNPFLHGRKVNGVTIVPPIGLPEDINVVLVGLNPAHAKRLVEEIPEFRRRRPAYFFL